MSQRGRLDRIPKAIRGHALWTADHFNALLEAVRLNLNITGHRVFTDRGGIHIARQPIPKPKVGFRVEILGTTSTGWPALYRWVEVELVGSGQALVYNVRPGGFHSDFVSFSDPGLGEGINSVELIDDFGSTVGPYGQPLVDGNSTLTVLEVATGSHPWMRLRKNDSGFIVPEFEAYNPMTLECTP